MVVQGELIVKFETIAKSVGEMVGGFSTAGKGKQPEKDPTKMGLLGGLGAKALMGSEGFGGLKKTMGVMSGPIGKLGGSLMKGGVIGMATSGITTIMGIISKALGSSSIFTGVAAQFWKIAGVMVDMLLMPLLPYMMKFIQWMMTAVMPEIMKLSKGISKALNGDIGPLLAAYFSLVMTVMEGMYIKIPRLFMDPLVVAIKNMGWGEDTTVAEYRKERSDKEAGMVDGGGIMDSKKMKAAAALPVIGGVFAAAQGIMAIKKAMTGTEEKQKEFGDNLTRNAQDTQEEMSSFVDGEKNKGKVWWKQWDLGMHGNSILPQIKDDTHGYLDTLSKEAEDSGDGLFSWVKGINWGIFGKVGTAIKDGAKAVFEGLETFFTETLPGYLPTWGDIGKAITDGVKGIGSLLGAAKTAVVDVVKGLWGSWNPSGIMGIIPDLLSNIPGWDKVYSAAKSAVGTIGELLGDAKTAVENVFFGIWGDWKLKTGIAGIIPNLLGFIPSFGDIFSLPEGASLDNLKTLAVDKIKGIANALWGSWNPEGIMGIIPNLLDKLPKFSDIFSLPDWGSLEELKTLAISKIKGIMESLWGSWNPVGIMGIIPNLLDKLPSFGDIFDLETYKDLGTLALNTVTKVVGAIWGSWSGKDGIAGLIPNLMSKIPDIGSMMGDLMSISVEGVSKTQKDKLVDQFGGTAKRNDIESEVGSDEFGWKTIQKEAYDVEIGIVEYFKQIGSLIKEKAMVPVNWVKDKYNSLKSLLGNLGLPDWDFGDLMGVVKNIANAVIGGINQAICWVVEKYNSTIGKIGFPPEWKFVGGMGLSITPPQIDKWHTGGIVPGGPSTNVPAILQGGERVIPRSSRSQMGGGGGTNQTFNININSNFSPGDIIRSIAQSGATDEVAYLNTVG